MATTVAAMKASIGSTNYFIVVMKAMELAGKAIIPSEMDGWEGAPLEEVAQRDINYARVKNHIAPYLASDDDRFFGAVIVMAKNFDSAVFEPIADAAAKKMPSLYKSQAQLMGYLTLSGEEALVLLDGQHRLKAIQFAVAGRDEKNSPIAGLSPNFDVASDDVTVILIPCEDKKARKIFTKVNRYAKQNTAGQNLATDDDDIVAVLSRDIANDPSIIGPGLVKYKSNTLNNKERYFTTLATLAECNEVILKTQFGQKIDRARPTSGAKRILYEEKVREIWGFLVENIELFSDMLANKDDYGDWQRRDIRESYLLGKPAPQACLVSAFARLIMPPTNLTYVQAADKLNAIDWGKRNAEWDRVFLSGGKLLTKNKRLVADLLYYRAGGKMNEEKKNELLKKYREQFPENERDKKAKCLPPLL